MILHEIVVREIQADCSFEVFELLAESVCEAGNSKGFMYSIEGKDTYWGEIGLNYADPRYRVIEEIPPGQSVEFIGLLNKDAPIAKGKTEVRGVVTVYVDATDINGRHISSPALPFPR